MYGKYVSVLVMERKFDEDGFCVVSRKKGRKKGGLTPRSKGNQCHHVLSMNSDIDALSLTVKIKQCVNDLRISRFYSEFKETWQVAQHEISSESQQNNLSAEHHLLEGLISKTGTKGKGHTLQSNLHSTQRNDEILARTEDDVNRRQASERTRNSSAHHVTDLIKDKSETTQSDEGCEEKAHHLGEHLESAGDKRTGLLEDHLKSKILEDRRVKQIVCYGLGNFSSCVTARFQLGLLILLNLLASPESCSLFDPNFTDVEKQVLEELGYSLINENEEGKRQSTEPTVFFMPHCGKPLYNNLLWANWGQRLSNLIILGNSFNNFSERFTAKQLKEEVPYIDKIIPYHREVSVRNSFQYTDIFNDMAFQVFPFDMLQTAPLSLWADKPEPSYDHMSSVEIITSSSTR